MKICLPLQFSVLLILFLHASNKHAHTHTRSSTLAHTHTHTQVDTLHHNAIRRLFAISSAAADAAQHFGSFLSGFSGFFLSSFSHAFVFPLLQVLRRALKPHRAAAELAQLPRLALLQFFAYADCDFPFLHFSLSLSLSLVCHLHIFHLFAF